MISSDLISVVQMSIGFLLVFTAFQTCSNIQEYVIQNIASNATTESDLDPKAGFYSLAIIYGVFTISNFFVPIAVSKITNKWSMVVGSFTYVLFLASFLFLKSWLFYLTSFVLGVGAAMIWVGQGSYLSDNSNEETMNRNTGIFWALLQCSLPAGGLFIYVRLKSTNAEQNKISMDTIKFIYYGFTGLAILGFLVLLFLRKPKSKENFVDLAPIQTPSPTRNEEFVISADHSSSQVDSVTLTTCSETSRILGKSHSKELLTLFGQIFILLKTKPMLLLSFPFVYSGLELTFWSGIYGTTIANTLRFTTASTELLALNTIFIGIGEIMGGGMFGIFGTKFNKFGRSPIILVGLVVHILSFFIIFINIPAESPMVKTMNVAYIEPDQYLALVCSVLIGFADACWNTQIFSLLGSFYADNNAAAFGIFKFFQSGSACVAFFYGGHLLLHWQLAILTLVAPFAALAFCKVDNLARIELAIRPKNQ